LKRARQIILRGRVFATLFFFFIVSLAVFYVWERFTAVELTIRLERLKEEIVTLENTTKKLEIEKTSLSSHKRIERIALTELGLKYPANDQIVIVTADSNCVRLGEKE
jgi:cell division protein FtsL